MKLLSKREIDQRRSEEQQAQAQEGLKLARRVDRLRELASEEEASLERFRSATVGVIHQQIAEKSKELDEITNRLQSRRNELEEYFAPLDVAWGRFKNAEKAHIVAERTELATMRRTLMDEREQAEIARTEARQEAERLSKERKAVKELAHKAQQTLEDAKTAKQQADKDAKDTKALADQVLLEARHIREQAALERKKVELDTIALSEREAALEKREMEVLIKELEFYSPIKNPHAPN